MRKTMLCLLVAALFAGCSDNGKKETEIVGKDVKISGDTLTVSSASPLKDKIGTDTVEARDHDLSLRSSGVVIAIPSVYAEVAAPFGGRARGGASQAFQHRDMI